MKWPVHRDRWVGRWFWYVQTAEHRWSIRVHFWLHRSNVCRLNRQPKFSELRLARCAVICRADRKREIPKVR